MWFHKNHIKNKVISTGGYFCVLIHNIQKLAFLLDDTRNASPSVTKVKTAAHQLFSAKSHTSGVHLCIFIFVIMNKWLDNLGKISTNTTTFLRGRTWSISTLTRYNLTIIQILLCSTLPPVVRYANWSRRYAEQMVANLPFARHGYCAASSASLFKWCPHIKQNIRASYCFLHIL